MKCNTIYMSMNKNMTFLKLERLDRSMCRCFQVIWSVHMRVWAGRSVCWVFSGRSLHQASWLARPPASGSQARLLLSCDELLTDLRGSQSGWKSVFLSACSCVCVSTSLPRDLIYTDKATGLNNKNVYFSSLSFAPSSCVLRAKWGEAIRQNKPTARMTSSNFCHLNPSFLYFILIILL